MSQWINDTKRIWKKEEKEKPCHTLGYCPYGQLVECYPLHPEFDDLPDKELNNLGDKIHTGYNCKLFGHDCPVYYQAEEVTEEN